MCLLGFLPLSGHVFLLIARCKGVVDWWWFSLSKVQKGVVFTCVSLALPLSCFSTYRKVKRGCFKHMSAPGFPSVMSLYLSQCETGGCDTCLYLVFPLSCPSSYRNARKM